MAKKKLVRLEDGFEAEREDQERQNYDDSLREEQDREEIELFRQIQEDEREENEKIPTPDNRTYAEKIAAWDDGGCSTGLNDD